MDDRLTYAAVVGQVVQQLRAGHMSQQMLATKAGLSQSSLSRFEKGQTLPDMFEMRRLAAALGKKPADFVALIEQALTRTTEVAKKVSPLDDLAAIALAGLAVVAVATLLDELGKPQRKKRKT